MTRHKCVNCGKLPKWATTALAGFKFSLIHNEPACPNRVDAHNSTMDGCIKAWNNANAAFRP